MEKFKRERWRSGGGREENKRERKEKGEEEKIIWGQEVTNAYTMKSGIKFNTIQTLIL